MILIKMVRTIIILVVIVMLLLACSSLPKWEGARQAAAVPIFSNTSQEKLNSEFLKGLTDIFTTELIKTGRFSVVERGLFDEKLKENKSTINPNDAIKTGRQVKAPYIILAAVSDLNIIENNVVSGPVIQNIFELNIVLSARVLETESGLTVAAAERKVETTIVKGAVNLCMLNVSWGGGPNSLDPDFRILMTSALKELSEDLYAQKF